MKIESAKTKTSLSSEVKIIEKLEEEIEKLEEDIESLELEQYYHQCSPPKIKPAEQKKFLQELYERTDLSSIAIEQRVRLCQNGYIKVLKDDFLKNGMEETQINRLVHWRYIKNFFSRLLDKNDLAKEGDGFVKKIIEPLEKILFAFRIINDDQNLMNYFFIGIINSSSKNILKKLHTFYLQITYESEVFKLLEIARDEIAKAIIKFCFESESEKKASMEDISQRIYSILNYLQFETAEGKRRSTRVSCFLEIEKFDDFLKSQYSSKKIINYIVGCFQDMVSTMNEQKSSVPITLGLLEEIFSDFLIYDIVSLTEIYETTGTDILSIKEDFIKQLPELVGVLLARLEVIPLTEQPVKWLAQQREIKELSPTTKEKINNLKMIAHCCKILIPSFEVWTYTTNPKLSGLIEKANLFHKQFNYFLKRTLFHPDFHLPSFHGMSINLENMICMIKINKLAGEIVELLSVVDLESLEIKRIISAAQQAYEYENQPQARLEALQKQYDEFLIYYEDCARKIVQTNSGTLEKIFGERLKGLAVLSPGSRKQLVKAALDAAAFYSILSLFEYNIGEFGGSEIKIPDQLKADLPCAIALTALGKTRVSPLLVFAKSSKPIAEDLLIYICQNRLTACFQRFAFFNDGAGSHRLEGEKLVSYKDLPLPRELEPAPALIPWREITAKDGATLLHIATKAGSVAIVTILAGISLYVSEETKQILYIYAPRINPSTRVIVIGTDGVPIKVTAAEYALNQEEVSEEASAAIKILNSLIQAEKDSKPRATPKPSVTTATSGLSAMTITATLTGASNSLLQILQKCSADSDLSKKKASLKIILSGVKKKPGELDKVIDALKKHIETSKGDPATHAGLQFLEKNAKTELNQASSLKS